MKIKLIIISIILVLVIVFATGCIPVMEKLGLVNPTNEEQLSSEKGGPPDGLVKVLIGFKEKPGASQQAMVRGVGGKIKYTYHIVDAIAASIPEKAIEALQKNPNVTHVELDGEVFAVGETLPWGVDRIDAEKVWTDYTGQGVKVAIIDSGIDNNHPDLNVRGGVNFVSKPSWKIPDPNKWDDDYGHGTHVAGIVAALDNDIGVVGVAPGANLYALKVLDRTGRGYVSDVIAAIDWSASNGIQVINMSLGGGASDDLEIASSSAYDNGNGLILVAAAGNGGSVIFPAAYDSVIAVSATDINDELAWFSSTGDEVELAAPGVDIYSTYKDGGYTTYSGTSMAAPHVAGVAALVITSGTTVASDVRGKLTGTADDLGAIGRDSLYGYGLVDADEAAEAAGAENKPPTVSITSPADGSTFDSGAKISFVGTANDPEEGDLTDSLVWTSTIDDQIGTGGSFDAILSDGTHTITAEVTDSGGKTGSDSISITVGISSNIMHVSDITFSAKKAGKNLFLYTMVKVVLLNEDNNIVDVVGGATVSMTLANGGGPWSFVGDTGSDGTVKFTLKAQSGNYIATVKEVSHPDYAWNEVETTNSCLLNKDGTID